MNKTLISKEKMKEICGSLMADKRLIAPASNGKVVDFLEITNVEQILMGDELAYKSPKEFFFPRSEKILSFKDGEAQVMKPDKGVVIFGVRPCDLEALQVMTKIFTTGKFGDPFFQAHLDNTLVIGVGCIDKKSGCFCDRLGINLAYSNACDLCLANKGDGYEVTFVSEKGKAALAPFMPEIKDFVNEEVPAPTTEGLLSIAGHDDEVFDKIDWETITETCQSCGVCTYLCPTCHCFDFKDVEEGGVASRFRNWDSCMFPKFTLHASGHNPRDSKKERYRQRVLHKYLYIKKNFDCVACTGCGRCVRSCPAGMNIQTIVEGIMEDLS